MNRSRVRVWNFMCKLKTKANEYLTYILLRCYVRVCFTLINFNQEDINLSLIKRHVINEYLGIISIHVEFSSRVSQTKLNQSP